MVQAFPFPKAETDFNSPNADLVLRTCDGVDLRVHACILADASPFFETMLSLPQPEDPVEPILPVVDIPETAEMMTAVLHFVYPRTHPVIDNLSYLARLLSAALKYDFTAAIHSLCALLVSPPFIDNEPTRVYAIACAHHLEDEAKLASSRTLKLRILDCSLPDELKYITAYDYVRLLKLHRSRAEAAQALLIRTSDVKCGGCSALHYGNPCAPKWWEDFEQRARLELMVHPVTDTIFSMPFLSQSSNAGCARCGSSMFAAHEFLSRLKASIDALPSTV